MFKHINTILRFHNAKIFGFNEAPALRWLA